MWDKTDLAADDSKARFSGRIIIVSGMRIAMGSSDEAKRWTERLNGGRALLKDVLEACVDWGEHE